MELTVDFQSTDYYPVINFVSKLRNIIREEKYGLHTRQTASQRLAFEIKNGVGRWSLEKKKNLSLLTILSPMTRVLQVVMRRSGAEQLEFGDNKYGRIRSVKIDCGIAEERLSSLTVAISHELKEDEEIDTDEMCEYFKLMCLNDDKNKQGIMLMTKEDKLKELNDMANRGNENHSLETEQRNTLYEVLFVSTGAGLYKAAIDMSLKLRDYFKIPVAEISDTTELEAYCTIKGVVFGRNLMNCSLGERWCYSLRKTEKIRKILYEVQKVMEAVDINKIIIGF